MILEVLTPQKLLYRGHVNHVKMPGIGGSFGVLPQHAPLISALEKGYVEVTQNDAENKSFPEYAGTLLEDDASNTKFSFSLNGGVVEVQKDKVIILAE